MSDYVSPPVVAGVIDPTLDATFVHRASAETITGAKTFSTNPVFNAAAIPESAVANLTTDLAAKATDTAVVHLAGAESIAGVKTFTANPVFNAASIPESAITNLTTDLAAKATDTLAAHLAGTETFTGAKTFTGGLITNSLTITGGTANTSFGSTGSLTFFQSNGVRVWGSDTTGAFILGSGNGAAMARSAVSSGVNFVNNAINTTDPRGIPYFSMDVSQTNGSASVVTTRSHYVTTSLVNPVTRTLPTPANSYVGQILWFMQEAAHVFTVTAPAGVTVTMLTAAATLTSKTAASFVTSGNAADDGTTAMLVCISTDGSTVAAWRSLSNVGGYWT